MNKFFVSTPLGFEKMTVQQMKEVWPFLLGKDARPHGGEFPEIQILEGGFEFEADLILGLQLNFFLKTAHRVLFRMSSFKARDLPKFYQKFKSLPWQEYLSSAHVEWEVAAQKSRLNNEKRLQESAEKALQEIFPKTGDATPLATIYIRMDDDTCTISLDSTGEHLHKRGWTILKGEAPLRETIAAACLTELKQGTSESKISEITLFDPMMGSGTFLTEARTLNWGQFHREFAFQKWKKAPKLFQSSSFVFNYKLTLVPQFKSYKGFDIAGEMVEIANKNYASVESILKTDQRTAFQNVPFEASVQDSLLADLNASEKLWMIVNPPYGERLPESLQGGLRELVKELCHRYKPQKLGVLYPEKEKIGKAAPQGYKVSKEVKISNGGIRCLLTILTRL